MWELDLPEYDQLTVRPVSGVRTELRQAPGGGALACWQRDGFCYGLYLPAGEMGLAGSLLELFAADCRVINYPLKTGAWQIFLPGPGSDVHRDFSSSRRSRRMIRFSSREI